MKWCKTRHRVIQYLLRPLFKLYFRLRYGVKTKYNKLYPEGALILSNHVTVMDMFYVGMSYKTPIYYMASIDIFEHFLTGKLIKFLVNPIAKEKSKKSDITSVRNCIKVAKENGTICIFPEGNRTFTGKLGYVDPSIVKLVKVLKKPLIIFNINNGYGIDPRWSKKERKGKFSFGEKKVVLYEEYSQMSDEEIYKLIIDGLTVNDLDFEHQFTCKTNAEYLERVTYICPKCKKMHTLYSKKDKVICSSCGLEVKYKQDLSFESSDEDFTFKTVADWYDYQVDVIKNTTYEDDTLIYKDDVGFYNPRLWKSRKNLGKGTISVYNNRFEIITNKVSMVLNFDDIAGVTILGKKKMNIYHNGVTYQIFGDKKMNLIKYVHLFYILKNRKEGIENGFIGL